MSETAAASFTGHQPRECTEHRTVGPHRAWCFDCSEWCYPNAPCTRCEIPALRADRDQWNRRAEDAEATVARVRADCEEQSSGEALRLGDDSDTGSGEGRKTWQLGVWAQARRTLNILNGPQGTPAARPAAPAGAGETGGTPETQEGRQ